ncbi:hypothetical protein [Rhizobium mongolense]|uniref:hypothetical protein n=1 Tax=Rhizobium mongolense TaxID=57676 RepID=UPI0034A37732
MDDHVASRLAISLGLLSASPSCHQGKRIGSAIIGLMRRGGWPKQAETTVNKFEIILNDIDSDLIRSNDFTNRKDLTDG